MFWVSRGWETRSPPKDKRVHVAQTGNERPLSLVSLPFSDEEALGGNVAVHAAIAFIITCRCEGKQQQNA